MIQSRSEIVKIKDVDQLTKEFHEFEEQLESKVQPLRDELGKVVLTSDLTQLESHMSKVEAYRAKVALWMSYVVCFLQHAKGSTFLLKKSPTVTSDDRLAYQRAVTAVMESVLRELEELIKCIDSRVNLVKKIVGTTGS